MILARFGRRLVELYNERSGASLTAAAFFEEEFYPIVYDHPTFLQVVSNSPFFGAYKKAKGGDVTGELRAQALVDLKHKAAHVPPDGSFVVGYPAGGTENVTSGQVSANRVPLDTDDVFATWLGAALALGVSGGYSLLIEHDEVLWETYLGWGRYRERVNNPEPSDLKAQQINTWNTWHLTHRWKTISPHPLSWPDLRMAKKAKPSDPSQIAAYDWSRLMLTLARRFPTALPTAYVFALGSTNTTVGFLPLRLDGIARMEDLRVRLFQNDAELADAQLDRLYQSDLSFRMACEQGAIGLQALSPAGLRPFLDGKDAVPKPGKLPLPFHLYSLWILAMLGNDRTALYDLARTTAADLVAFVDAGRGTGRNNLVNELLKTRALGPFVDQLTAIVKNDPGRFATLDVLAERAATMNGDTLRLFLTLLAFQYAGQSRQHNTPDDEEADSSDDSVSDTPGLFS